LNAAAVEPRQDAVHRTALGDALAALPPASTALALQCDEAFGLALRAWHDEGVNFFPTARAPSMCCAAHGCWVWLCAPWVVLFWPRDLPW